MLEASGASLICVHARTKEQLYAPGIDLSVIERTKRAVSIPVVGNGDIYTAKDALEMIDKTGCDGVMIGRGAEGNPWIFSEIVAAMDKKEYVYPSAKERFEMASYQLDAMIIDKGERVGLAEAKKHMAWYINGIKGAAQARSSIMTASSAQEIKDVFNGLLSAAENTGE